MAVKERARTATLSFALKGKKYKVLTAAEIKNCDCRDGALIAPVRWRRVGLKGDSAYVVALDPCAVGYIYAWDDVNKVYDPHGWALTKSGEFYYYDIETLKRKVLTGLKDATIFPAVIGAESWTCVLAAGKYVFLKANGQEYSLLNIEGSKGCGAFYKHRLFYAVAPSDLGYFAPESLTDFAPSADGGGRFRLSDGLGEIVAMKPFGEKLYLFFERAIMEFDGAGAPEDFKIKPVPYAGGLIFGKSVVVSNQGIYFMSADGVYRFNGNRVEKLPFDFVKAPQISEVWQTGAAGKGKIFMRYRSVDDEWINFVFCEDNGECFYVDDMANLSMEKGGIVLFTDKQRYFCTPDLNGEYGYDGRFNGAETNFGIGGRKRVKKLYFFGQGKFTFTMKNGGRTLQRSLTFKNGRVEVPMSECGDSFVFDFLLEKGTRIDKVIADMRVVS